MSNNKIKVVCLSCNHSVLKKDEGNALRNIVKFVDFCKRCNNESLFKVVKQWEEK